MYWQPHDIAGAPVRNSTTAIVLRHAIHNHAHIFGARGFATHKPYVIRSSPTTAISRKADEAGVLTVNVL